MTSHPTDPPGTSGSPKNPAPKADHLTWHGGGVGPAQRAALLGQRGATVWFTGLSGSGKSTVAVAVEAALHRLGRLAYRLDGDNVRHGLCANLGFSPEDRDENIRRIGETAKLFADAGVICLCSFVSPYRAARDGVRATHQRGTPTPGSAPAPGSTPAPGNLPGHPPGHAPHADAERSPPGGRSEASGTPGTPATPLPFFEVFVDVPVDVAARRDPKGLYEKARRGEIKDFTGISAPFEAPPSPELHLPTHELSLDESVQRVLAMLRTAGVIPG